VNAKNQFLDFNKVISKKLQEDPQMAIALEESGNNNDIFSVLPVWYVPWDQMDHKYAPIL
jgi:hypothetical protein